jgi:nucleotide-binding universal stress UspA family protein
MSAVLLLVPADRQVTSAIETALDLAARREASLVAAVVVDDAAAGRLSSRMIDVGLLAEKITDQVSEALMREHQVRGQALLREIAERARARGIPCRTTLEIGDPGEICRVLAQREDCAVAVVVTEKRSWVTRIFAGGQPLEVPAFGGCAVVPVEED